MPCVEVSFAGQTVLLDAAGVLFWPAQSMLVVSDLHLGKAAALARHGHALPGYDAADTLMRLRAAIARYHPHSVVCLGDSFHDTRVHARLDTALLEELGALCAAQARWIWILGNHDPDLPAHLPGERHGALACGPLLLRHEPDTLAAGQAQLIGHFHPKATRRLAGQKISGRCFLLGAQTLMMPAFGSYTGGLDSAHAAITKVFGGRAARRFLLYRARIWAV